MQRVPGTVAGLLLAAGAGRRMGGPKALVADASGTAWVTATARRLAAARCDPVRVVLGAEADRGRAALQGELVDIVVADDWAEGMGVSLRRGLDGLDLLAPAATAVLVQLVDLPDVGVDAVRRLMDRAAADGVDALARASYAGTPGHPVLIGRAHWAGVAAEAGGDRGARDYLATRPVKLVECGDLATGRDVDQR